MYSLDSSQALNKNGHCHTHFQWMYSNLPTSNSISWQPPSSKYCHFLKASTNRLCTNLFHKWVGLTKRNLLSSCKSARRRTPGRPSTCPGWVGAVNTTKATVVLSLNVSYTFIHHLLYYKHGAWCVVVFCFVFCCCFFIFFISGYCYSGILCVSLIQFSTTVALFQTRPFHHCPPKFLSFTLSLPYTVLRSFHSKWIEGNSMLRYYS